MVTKSYTLCFNDILHMVLCKEPYYNHFVIIHFCINEHSEQDYQNGNENGHRVVNTKYFPQRHRVNLESYHIIIM